MWFIFISARRFVAGLLPLQPCGWTGTGSFRREPPNSTGGTFTHVLRTLRGLLRVACLLQRTPPKLFFLFFGGAAQ